MIFSDRGMLTDLEGLRQRAGLSAEDWEDLLQYTAQVMLRLIRRGVGPHPVVGAQQPCQLQVFWFHQIHPPFA
jgi:hypothetical protein